MGIDLNIWIAGTPKGKPAPRFTVRTTKQGKPVLISYPAKSAKDWESALERQLIYNVPGRPIEKPIAITAIFHLLRPKSHYGVNGLRSKYQDARHIQRPDLDNLLKSLDVLTKLGMWRDDSVIWSVLAAKIWADGNPGLELQITTEWPYWARLLYEAAELLNNESDSQRKRELAGEIMLFLKRMFTT